MVSRLGGFHDSIKGSEVHGIGMNAESLSFLLLALGILGTHGATLRLLYHCKRELNQHLSTTDERAQLSGQSLDEIVRIGADMADALDGIIGGLAVQESAGSPVLTRPPSLQDTIIQLMVEKFLPSNYASESEERPIHLNESPQKENDDDQSEPAPTQE